MSFHAAFLIFMAVVTLVLFPIMMIWSLVDHLRGKKKIHRGSGTFSAGVGAAMQELDRIMTRPSIGHQIETEHRVLKREDDSGED